METSTDAGRRARHCSRCGHSLTVRHAFNNSAAIDVDSDDLSHVHCIEISDSSGKKAKLETPLIKEEVPRPSAAMASAGAVSICRRASGRSRRFPENL